MQKYAFNRFISFAFFSIWFTLNKLNHFFERLNFAYIFVCHSKSW